MNIYIVMKMFNHLRFMHILIKLQILQNYFNLENVYIIVIFQGKNHRNMLVIILAISEG